MVIEDLGIVGYQDAYRLQEDLVADVFRNERKERLLLLEHPPVYTIGRGGDSGNVLDPAIDVVRINRGGDITFHGPGQLVGYPILRLGRRGKDLRHYLRFLEEVIICVAGDFGVASYRVPGRTGVWTERGKLASIGVAVRHWVTMHGFALNVNTDLSFFQRIHPCGIIGCPVTSLSELCGSHVSMHEVKARFIVHFTERLDAWLPLDADVLEEVRATA
ncbi:MAG: lipoyl(octanoyl) transferase LipB [Geobacteraceae bacterium]|nr:lipoyl(octanoyl) transferase LipB [Geobacteraceae bacterium]